jgi:spermidine/putrescine transport system substrate-binding protein
MTRDPRQAHGHDLSRRDFLKRTAGAAVAIPAAAEILAACTKPGTTSSTGSLPYQIARPEKPVTLPMNGDPIPSDTQIEQGADLQILNWSQYMWKYVLNQFVESHQADGITFTAPSTFQNMDEGVAKLQAGQKADVFFPTIDVMGKLVAADLLQPLNHDLIPALQKDNWKTFQNPYYDQGWRYSVPYTIYTTGIGYRRDHIPDDVIHGMDNPWEILWDPQYASKVGAYPSYRVVMGIAMMNYCFTDMNTIKESDLESVRKVLISLIVVFYFGIS